MEIPPTQWLSRSNKFLIVQAKVVLTPTIDKVIANADKVFEKHAKQALVTSGLRGPDDQLRIIQNFLTEKGLSEKYPEAMICHSTDRVGDQYTWQKGWSALLNAGIIINPAYDAICLMHTTFDDRDRFNQLIHQTPHHTGNCFDVGGGSNKISDELAILQEAINEKSITGLVHILAEHGNNCVHCDCKAI